MLTSQPPFGTLFVCFPPAFSFVGSAQTIVRDVLERVVLSCRVYACTRARSERSLMILRSSRALLAVLTLAGAGACSSSNALQPSASIGAPPPLQTAAGMVVRNNDQPVTLIVQNATVTGSAATTYTFEFSTDS